MQPSAPDPVFDGDPARPGRGTGILDRWEYLFAVPAAMTMLGLVGLTFVDVVGRYFVGRPVRGATELVELAMVILIFLGLPLVTRHGEHISLDFVDRIVAPRIGRLIGCAMSLTMAACLFWLAWLMALKALDIGRSGDATIVLNIALAPFIFFIAAAAVVDGLVNLAMAFRMLRPEASR